jgi:DNA-directed RNA polymerase specialized sigma24 family protein
VMKSEHLDAITKVAKRLAPKYRFGFYETEDIEQEAFIIGMQVLDKYDSSKSSLEYFLFIHINNRLKTFKRDNYHRLCPCNGEDSECPRCLKLEKRKNLMTTAPLIEPTYERSPADDLHDRELIDKILNNISKVNRADLLRIMDGKSIPPHRKEKVESEVILIISNFRSGDE